MIQYVLLVSRQGKIRLTKWFTTMQPKEKQRLLKEVSTSVLARRSKMCNVLEYKGTTAAGFPCPDSSVLVYLFLCRS